MGFDSLLWFVLFVGLLVFFHELGHFLTAKACGIKVLRFSVGFGPRLLGLRRGDTEYCVSLLPLGGYVKMLGDTSGGDVPPEETEAAFSSKPVWQRALVLAAGPGFNLLLAVVVYFAMFTGVQTFGDTKLGIVSRADPAWAAGLRPGDKILAVAGEEVTRWEELRDAISQRPGDTISVVYERDGEAHTARIRPTASREANVFQEIETRGRIGVSLQFLKPVLAVVDNDSPAAVAGLRTGDVIEAVGSTEVVAWHEVRAAVRSLPATQPISLSLTRGDEKLSVALTPTEPHDELDPELFSAADAAGGRYTGLVNKDCVVERVDDGTPASTAGLQVGDRLLAVRARDIRGRQDERAIGVWGIDLAAMRGVDMRNEVVITFQRGGHVMRRKMHLWDKEEQDEFKNKRTVRVFGAFNDPAVLDTYVFERRVGPAEAFLVALRQVGDDMTIISKGLAKVIGGSIPLDTMGGPIMLFVIADKAAKRGLLHYLRLLAMISVNLALINLLPIPVLDGGHLMFCAIEAARRRPPSLRVRELANVFGFVLLLLMMALVFRNDILRFVLG